VESISDFDSQSHFEPNSGFILQKDIIGAPSFSIPVSPNQSILNEASEHGLTMADIADCVTGFYSGCDKIFLRRASETVKRSNGYKIVDPELIENHPFSNGSLLDGIAGKCCFIPILKGGGYNFIKPTQWYIEWSKETVTHYKCDKKARFQNPSYYFRKGVGFPMVTSTKPTAALIDDSLFDQSIVGIFPKGSVSLEFILAYCNSMPFWACLKAINPSANNSAKYISRTPIILPEIEEQEKISVKTRELILLLRNGNSSASRLKADILRSITQYVKRKATKKAPEPMAIRAVEY
jgi:hypothetical protein